MFTLTNPGLSTVIRLEDVTVIIARRPAKRGMFRYIPMADLMAIDQLLTEELSIDNLDHFKRLFSGYCPKREAAQYVRWFSTNPTALLNLLESKNMLKEKVKVEDNVLMDYRLRDGYRITLQNVAGTLYVVEEEKGSEIGKSKMLTLREGQSHVKKAVEAIENLEGVSFQIIKA